jgi:hypothetical protein
MNNPTPSWAPIVFFQYDFFVYFLQGMYPQQYPILNARYVQTIDRTCALGLSFLISPTLLDTWFSQFIGNLGVKLGGSYVPITSIELLTILARCI